MGISRFALRPTVFIHTPPPGLMKPFCMFRILYCLQSRFATGWMRLAWLRTRKLCYFFKAQDQN